MGNCQQQFQNVPETQTDNRHDVKRMGFSSVSVINRTHLKVEPQNAQQIKIGAINQDYINRQLDQQRLHDTRMLNTQNLFRLKNTKKQVLKTQQDAVLQQLDFHFMYSLGLPQYSYRSIPQHEAFDFQELEMNQNTDRYGVKYIGEWKNNKIHGNGVLTSNTKKYIGQFKNGLKHFHGRQIEKRQVFEGQFQDGRRRGRGTRYTPERQENGIFDQKLKKGQIKFRNGCYFDGTLQNDQFHGINCLFYDSKAKVIYQGEFSRGKVTQKGRWYSGSLYLIYINKQGQFFENQEGAKKGEYQYDQKNGILNIEQDLRSRSYRSQSGLHGPQGNIRDVDEESVDENLPTQWR